MAEHTGTTGLTGWQLALQVRRADVPADAPVALKQSHSVDELAAMRNEHIQRTVREAGIGVSADRITGEDLLDAYERLAARRAAERTQA